MSVVGFSPEDARRIAKVVRRVEKMPFNSQGQRRRHVTASTPSRGTTIARLTGSLDACDTSAQDLLATDFAGMPSATATIYRTALDDSNLIWAAGQEETVYNASPFAYANTDDVWLTNVDGHWLVDRAHAWKPRAYLAAGSSGPVSPVAWSLPYNKGDIVRLENTNGRIVVNAPVDNQPFRVQIRIRAAQGAGQTEWHARLELIGNLYGTVTVDEVAFGAPSVSPAGGGYLELGFDEVVTWSKDDYFEVHLRDQSGNAAGKSYGYVTIEPLF